MISPGDLRSAQHSAASLAAFLNPQRDGTFPEWRREAARWYAVALHHELRGNLDGWKQATDEAHKIIEAHKIMEENR